MEFHPAVQPAALASASAWYFAFVEGQLLLPEHLPADRPTLVPMPGEAMPETALARHYLGRCGDHDAWALKLEAVPRGWRGMPLRAAMMAFPPVLMALAGRAAQVLEWDRAHRFCGVCGTPTELLGHERARRCPACQHTAYPRISPAMMALVWREGELLLARSPHYTKGMYSALAGFVEAGESIEECVVREVAEEVGVQVTDLRYYGSQSWPFPHSLMIAFTARWVSGEIVPQEGEIEHAAWFPLDALPGIPPRFSVSGHLIRDTAEALREGRMGL
jgi:NAD+ diphosphatase